MEHQRIAELRSYFVEQKAHHAFRQPRRDRGALAKAFAAEGLSPLARAVGRVHDILDREIPVVFPNERIALMRTVPETPDLFTPEELARLREHCWIHESGDFNNFCPDYGTVLKKGFLALKAEIAGVRQTAAPENRAILDAMADMLDCLSQLARRYRDRAEETGSHVVAGTFSRIPDRPAETLLEALQFVRLLNYGLWCANNYQCALGRLDQTLFPYYQHDLEAGNCTRDQALELVEEFFLSLNRDSDLYDGVQQGDNGQSLVLGGRNPDGSDSFNDLSAIMLEASLRLRLIDPKINLRVDTRTPLSRFVKAVELTREGLGFPQYLNDDVIVPALLDWGYAPEDAWNYAAAACWEPIIPGRGTDVVNADGLNFPAAVLSAVEQLDSCPTYADFEQAVCRKTAQEAESLCGRLRNLYVFPAPMASWMMEGCIAQARDAAEGLRYRNIGIHGVGVSTAADSMAAVRRFLYETGELTPAELRTALAENFASCPLLKNRLRRDGPKMGGGNAADKLADHAAGVLLDAFAEALRTRRTERGGRFRAGTGTAMYYVWYGSRLPATPDGRCAGEPLPANYSPSLFARTRGPISVIKSFTKQNLRQAANGGPLTMELHSSVFCGQDSLEKAAQLVRFFILRGGHQLQLNAVNREKLLEAQRHPEAHRNLIVRVWGWSGYFVELDREFQDQILQRAEFSLE